MLSVLTVNNTLTKEQLNEYPKEELIDLIENYQKYVKRVETKKKTDTKVETTLNYTSPKINPVKKLFTYQVDSPLLLNEKKTFFTQKATNDRYKVPGESEREVIRYKLIINILLSAAANEQRTDLISEVQHVLNHASFDMY